MRVALDGTPLLGPRTGIGWYTADLILALADAAPADEFVVFPVSWRTARDVELPRRPNVTVVQRFAPAAPLRAVWNRVPFPALEWFVTADVFHATNYVAPPARRTPTVVTVHDVGFLHFPEMCGPHERALVHQLPRILRRTTAVVAVSDFTRRELLDWLPELEDRTVVITSAAHPRAVSDTTSAVSGPYVLMLGTLNPRKNIGLVLDAFAIVAPRLPELRLVLGGMPSPLLDVDLLIAERGLADRVVVTGYVEEDHAAALLASAAVLAFPSHYEGFGLPVLEAMTAGTAVVAVDAGATPEVAGGAAELVPEGDAGAFAAALERVVTDEHHRAELVRRGKARAEEFTWDRTAAQMLELYEKVRA